MKKSIIVSLFIVVNFLFVFRNEGTCAVTNLVGIRTGLHEDFTRVVLDSQGDYPLVVRRVSTGDVEVQYQNLKPIKNPERVFTDPALAVKGVELRREENLSYLLFTLRNPSSKVKTLYLPSPKQDHGDYRLVLDVYPAPAVTSAKPPVFEEGGLEDKGLILASAAEREIQGTGTEPDSEGGSVLSGKAEVTVRTVNGKGDSSKFEEYQHVPEPLSGNLELQLQDRDQYSLKIRGNDIAEDDQYLRLDGEWYGKLKLSVDYDELPHRFQYGARTLYSGIGSGHLVLDDTIQATLQATPPANVANQLGLFFNNAVSGDPELKRRKGTTKMDLVNFEPFRFFAEFKREQRDGTRPYFGSFGVSNTVEILEPIDYETTEVTVGGEYAPGSYWIKGSYYFSTFKNNIDTLRWDNPLRLNDALLGPSQGQLDLPPDNRYHSLSLEGALPSLPLHTRISANLSFGWMLQDDNLLPYTINTAIAAPLIPKEKVDAEVKTSLYNFVLTSRPWERLRVKGKFRRYEYNNKTEEITFAGFVDADDIFINTPVTNRPVSYKKTTAGASFAFDLYQSTVLTLSYDYENMDRENREASSQDDQILKGAFDTTPLSWLNLHASYERTSRDVENYVFDVYLDKGEDLTQNPLLRKYDQADMVRDRVNFLATVTPVDALVLSGSFIYGKDDFDKSPLGLLEDKHTIFSFDIDYALTQRVMVHAFYGYENYQNLLAGNGLAGAVVTDWSTDSEDKIHSAGGGVKIGLIDDKLDLDVSYIYSKADGDIRFLVPGGGFADFDNVDETRFQQFNTKLKYTYSEHWIYTLGYLYEKFDYSDYNKDGFTNIPVNAGGLYRGALLLGILPEDYQVDIFYLKLAYRF